MSAATATFPGWTRRPTGCGVDGLVARPLDLSMQDLRDRFRHRSVTAVLQCAGNRRADMRARHDLP